MLCYGVILGCWWGTLGMVYSGTACDVEFRGMHGMLYPGDLLGCCPPGNSWDDLFLGTLGTLYSGELLGSRISENSWGVIVPLYACEQLCVYIYANAHLGIGTLADNCICSHLLVCAFVLAHTCTFVAFLYLHACTHLCCCTFALYACTHLLYPHFHIRTTVLTSFDTISPLQQAL
jgi:hypothetical protein